MPTSIGLMACVASVSVSLVVLRRLMNVTKGSIWILSWGGLRGGISVALALALPDRHERELIVPITYIVVIFSVLVRLTLGRFARRISDSTPVVSPS